MKPGIGMWKSEQDYDSTEEGKEAKPFPGAQDQTRMCSLALRGILR